MNIIERLEALENAHRALAAQHIALQSLCKMLMPFISVTPCSMQQLTTTMYDALNEQMDEHKHDLEFQEMVRDEIDELIVVIASNHQALEGKR